MALWKSLIFIDVDEKGTASVFGLRYKKMKAVIIIYEKKGDEYVQRNKIQNSIWVKYSKCIGISHLYDMYSPGQP